MRRQAKQFLASSLARASAFSTDDAAITYVPATLGHNGGPALPDADLINEVIARGLAPAVARQLHTPEPPGAPPAASPQPLAISVKAACALIGVGSTSMWALIKSGQVDVIRPCRRTFVVVTSLHALVATLAASARQQLPEEAENHGGGNATSSSPGGWVRGHTK